MAARTFRAIRQFACMTGFAFIATLGMPLSGQAQTPDDKALSGADLVSLCRAEMAAPSATSAGKPGSPRWQCRSYLQGYFEAVRWLNQESDMRSPAQPPGLRPGGCYRLPDFISFPDLAKVVVEYGDKHPDAQKETGAQLMQRALGDRYPCPATPPG